MEQKKVSPASVSPVYFLQANIYSSSLLCRIFALEKLEFALEKLEYLIILELSP